MPRSSVLLGPTPISGDVVAAAAGRVWSAGRDLDPDADAFELRTLDDGAVLQVRSRGEVVLSVLRPRMLPARDEIARLLPAVDAQEAFAWWTDAYTPWQPHGAIGLAILDAVAAASGATVVHQGLAPARRDRDPGETKPR